ncbi:MAG: 6-bladed beta-propeller [Candidatus Eisenbacteria bacterium]|uniref:6-bladed beta-propeller n=1 Tax=Eiseniibacteriota bacterium TaxID=2212470 RepID=A0A7Y2E4R2_UNCEI|nr:6-bladed beta-propeller [Candidatus Eisenbacteria bacterium]
MSFSAKTVLMIAIGAVLGGTMTLETVLAAPWNGEVVTRDGVETVVNPAEPAQGTSSIELAEVWRLGGESEADEEFFGVIQDVAVDDDGNVYILDAQLSEVRVFDAEGNYKHTMGREGEGPGEFRRPMAITLTPSGHLAVMQMAPGKIVRLTLDGDPADDFLLPELDGGGRRMLQGMGATKDHMVVLGMDQQMGSGTVTLNTKLATYDTESNESGEIFASSREISFASFEFDEVKSGRLEWAPTNDGYIFASDGFDEYRIRRVRPDGTTDRVIERKYESLARTDEEIEAARSSFIIRGPVDPKITVSNFHPDISELYPREDGSLWVRTSRGDRESDGMFTFDIFDADGKFQKQLTVNGEGNSDDDGFRLIGDHLFVLRHQSSARQSMFSAGGGEEDEDEEAEPMEVICYKISTEG